MVVKMAKINPQREIQKLGYKLGNRKIVGGNGTIQDAIDQDGNYCAVKYPGRGAIKHDRFRNEVEAYKVLSGVRGIPKYYGVWGNEDKLSLLTIQFIEGETLEKARDNG